MKIKNKKHHFKAGARLLAIAVTVWPCQKRFRSLGRELQTLSRSSLILGELIKFWDFKFSFWLIRNQLFKYFSHFKDFSASFSDRKIALLSKMTLSPQSCPPWLLTTVQLPNIFLSFKHFLLLCWVMPALIVDPPFNYPTTTGRGRRQRGCQAVSDYSPPQRIIFLWELPFQGVTKEHFFR